MGKQLEITQVTLQQNTPKKRKILTDWIDICPIAFEAENQRRRHLDGVKNERN